MYKVNCTNSILLVFSTFIVFQKCQSQLLTERLLRQLMNRNDSNNRPPECIHDSLRITVTFDSENEFFNCFQHALQLNNLKHPDQNLRVNEVILKYGYTLDTFENLKTEDGYLLKIFRISGSPKYPKRDGKPVVLLVHGMGVASDVWTLGKNLAFKLADAGYDVWLPNLRGTDFSRGHVMYDANRDFEEYWDFSFHEMGVYDLPKIFELIQNKTGSEKLFYICHSAGCAAYAAALSEMPELNDKIEASFHLAPALYVGHQYGPFRVISGLLELGPTMKGLAIRLIRGRFELGSGMNMLQSRLCSPTALRCGLCGSMIFFLFGYDAPQIEFTEIPNIVSKVSNALSARLLEHFGQNYKTCMFRKRDYGYAKNMRVYGQNQPPAYNLSRLRAPMYIYYGESDNFVPPEDVEMTRNALPEGTVKGFYKVNWKLFNHLDFIIAKHADYLIYNNILDTIKTYVKASSNEINK